MKLDNFSFSGWQGCPLWYKTRILDRWTVRHKSAALGFGGAIHSGLATWYKTRDPDAAIEVLESQFPADQPVDDYRDGMKAKRVLLEYMQHYLHESFTVIPGMVEVSAALPTGTYLPVCPRCAMDNRAVDNYDKEQTLCRACDAELEPLEYGGIFDTLVDFSGQVYILEHKTTSMLGPRFFDQFKPNNQVTGYVWLAKQLSGRCDGAIINAIGVYKVGATRFERHITTRNDFDMAEWLQDLWTEACHIADNVRTGHFPMRSKACTLYGACEFLGVHQISDPSARQRYLEQDYVQEQWEFEKRDLRPSMDDSRNPGTQVQVGDALYKITPGGMQRDG